MPTKIEWCDETWNPITGCSPISAGCDNCYARRMARRLDGRYGYPRYPNHFEVTFHPDRLDQPLRWKKPRRIFVCSMGDLFHDDVSKIDIGRIWAIMDLTPQHKYLLLTKRPTSMKRSVLNLIPHSGIPQNIWLGVTAENQQTADERIPILLQIPAAVRFVSVEPMLERINLDLFSYTRHTEGYQSPMEYYGPDWIIAGPETGPGARECKPEWIEDLYEQCKAAGVPFFDKRKNYLAREFPGGKDGKTNHRRN